MGYVSLKEDNLEKLASALSFYGRRLLTIDEHKRDLEWHAIYDQWNEVKAGNEKILKWMKTPESKLAALVANQADQLLACAKRNVELVADNKSLREQLGQERKSAGKPFKHCLDPRSLRKGRK